MTNLKTHDALGAPSNIIFDLVVIGAGSGGLAAAKRAAALGARVLLIEADEVGGTCVRKGCVPKKLMVEAARLGHARKVSESFGWGRATGEHNFVNLVQARRQLVATLVKNHGAALTKVGVTQLRGRAKNVSAGEVSVHTPTGIETVSYKKLIIATGGAPILPEIRGAEHAVISDGLFALDTRPDRLVLVGGGYIAVEFAFMMQGLGTAVTLLVRNRLLRAFDCDLAATVEKNLQRAGVCVVKGANDLRLRPSADASETTTVAYRADDANHEIENVVCVLFATGRRPQGEGLGLETLGVEIGHDAALRVDENFRTAHPDIYAVGDVLNEVNLTPVAIRSGRQVAEHLFGGNQAPTHAHKRAARALIASAIFSLPPAGTVGLTEAEARAELPGGVRVYSTDFAPLTYAPVDKEYCHRTFMKVVVCAETDLVVGVHMVGDHAAEVIQAVAIALQAGATKADFDETLAVHPTETEELVLLRKAHD